MIKNLLTIKYGIIIAVAIAASITTWIFVGINKSEPKDDKNEIESSMKNKKSGNSKLLNLEGLDLKPRNDPPPVIKGE